VTTPSFPPRNEPNLFWLLAISLALHMLVFVLFSGVLSGGKQLALQRVRPFGDKA
jgi:hypothetical protein